MGKKGLRLHKSLKVYLSKLKKIPTSMRLSSTSSSTFPRPPATTSWLYYTCKYPRTPSFTDEDRNHGAVADSVTDARQVDDTNAATLSDVDRFLYENFQSLYSPFRGVDDEGAAAATTGATEGFSDYSVDYDSGLPGAEEIRSTGRFFTSPSTSNSLLGDARPSEVSSSLLSPNSSPSLLSNSVARPENAGVDGVAVMTFSKDPYDEFRQSMQDMVESREVDPSQPLDWDFMEELLFCYLELNDKSVHEYVLRAFTDLVVSCRDRIPPSDGADKASRM